MLVFEGPGVWTGRGLTRHCPCPHRRRTTQPASGRGPFCGLTIHTGAPFVDLRAPFRGLKGSDVWTERGLSPVTVLAPVAVVPPNPAQRPSKVPTHQEKGIQTPMARGRST